MNGPPALLGNTTGAFPIVSFADCGAPMTIVVCPVSVSEVLAPAAKVCARSVVPEAEVTLIQQSDVVAPMVSRYVAVSGA